MKIQGHVQRILEWNRKRNNLLFSSNLETQMLSEEANEFFMAETLVDRLDAYCDFQFVAIGTILKHFSISHKDIAHLTSQQSTMRQLVEYIESTKAQMFSILQTELTALNPAFAYNEVLIDEFFTDALNIVIDANEQKGTELDENGKVKKPVGFVKPEVKLETLILSKVSSNYRVVYH